MSRIKIKCRLNTKDQKLKLTEILCKNDIEIRRIFTSHDGFAVLTVSEQHADNIFQANIKNELEAHGFNAFMPPELKARKSVIIPRTDDIIYENDILDIGEELLKQNTWIGEEDLIAVYKFLKTPTIKLTFTQTILAKKCTEIGLKAFRIRIPGHEIKLETYIPIKCCMRCYTLEHHFTNECQKSRDFKVCSECSNEGHVWHHCQESYMKCINCGENHNTMAMKCNERKQILKEKRNEENERQKMTYSTVSQVNLPAKMPIFKMPTITKEELIKINICVAHAQAKNQQSPGTYSYELNRVLKANSLPTIIIPNDSDNTYENIHTEQGNTSENIHTEQDMGAMGTETETAEKESRTTPSLSRQSSYESIIGNQIDSTTIGLEF